MISAEEDQSITSVTESTGNVFADLGLPEAETRLAKAELARQIAATIRERKLATAAVARMLDLDEASLSALLSGRLSPFTLERLAHFLNLLGKDVEIVVRDKAPAEPVGRLSVVAA